MRKNLPAQCFDHDFSSVRCMTAYVIVGEENCSSIVSTSTQPIASENNFASMASKRRLGRFSRFLRIYSEKYQRQFIRHTRLVLKKMSGLVTNQKSTNVVFSSGCHNLCRMSIFGLTSKLCCNSNDKEKETLKFRSLLPSDRNKILIC